MSESLEQLARETTKKILIVSRERKEAIILSALRRAVEEEQKRHGEYMDHVTRNRRQAEADLSIAITALAVHHPGEELTVTKEQNRTLPLDRTLFARYDDDGNMYVAIRSRSKESHHVQPSKD